MKSHNFVRYTNLKIKVKSAITLNLVGWLIRQIRRLLMRKYTVSQNSRRVYSTSIKKFFLFLINEKPLLVSETLLEFVGATSGAVSLKKVSTFIENKLNSPPINFQPITARKKTTSKPGYSTYNSHRAAFFNLFRDYDVVMTQILQNQLTHYFKGLTIQSCDVFIIQVYHGCWNV